MIFRASLVVLLATAEPPVVVEEAPCDLTPKAWLAPLYDVPPKVEPPIQQVELPS